MLKLGTQTGSVMNHIHSRATNGAPEPEVGMGVTFLHWTDRSAGTITKVWTDKQGLTWIEAQEDKAELVSGSCQSEDQTYDYTPNPEGRRYTFKRTPSTFWNRMKFNEETKRWNKADQTPGVAIGFRKQYRDPCF